MGKINDQMQTHEAREPIRCPFCGAAITLQSRCRHVRWTFDQGGPLEFAQFALETSPYIAARGYSLLDTSRLWWERRAEWIVDLVLMHFDATEGYVFGELAQLDVLARDIWKEFAPDQARPAIPRY